MSESYTTIRYQRDGHVGNLTLARAAKRNAQNPLMWEELARLGTELVSDETLRCLVVMGEGPTFSARRRPSAGPGVRLPRLRAGNKGRPGGDALRDPAGHGRHRPAAADRR
jgi:hypothetical protein